MDSKTLQPDAPFRSGVSGKYKLLINTVELKYGKYALISTYLQGLHAGVDGKALASAIITILGMMLQTAA